MWFLQLLFILILLGLTYFEIYQSAKHHYFSKQNGRKWSLPEPPIQLHLPTQCQLGVDSLSNSPLKSWQALKKSFRISLKEEPILFFGVGEGFPKKESLDLDEAYNALLHEVFHLNAADLKKNEMERCEFELENKALVRGVLSECVINEQWWRFWWFFHPNFQVLLSACIKKDDDAPQRKREIQDMLLESLSFS